MSRLYANISPFYARGSSNHRFFWYPWGVLKESPTDTKGNCMYIKTHTDKSVLLFPWVLNLDTMVMKLFSGFCSHFYWFTLFRKGKEKQGKLLSSSRWPT